MPPVAQQQQVTLILAMLPILKKQFNRRNIVNLRLTKLRGLLPGKLGASRQLKQAAIEAASILFGVDISKTIASRVVPSTKPKKATRTTTRSSTKTKTKKAKTAAEKKKKITKVPKKAVSYKKANATKKTVAKKKPKQTKQSSKTKAKAAAPAGGRTLKVIDTTADKNSSCVDCGEASDQGRRPTMEDAHMIQRCGDDLFFGVFDGHGSQLVADLAAKQMYPFFMSHFKKSKDASKALRNAHRDVENIMRQEIANWYKSNGGMEKAAEFYIQQPSGNSSPAKAYLESGSTSAVIHVDRVANKITVAHLGDSRVVVGKCLPNGSIQPITMTEDHNPGVSAEEDAALRKRGAVIDRERYVTVHRPTRLPDGSIGVAEWGVAVTRALGDFLYKDMFPAAPPLNKKNFITAIPAIRTISAKDICVIVVACDGVWDVMSNESAVDLASICRREGKTAKETAQEIVDTALMLGSGDNITAVVAFL
jgi:serine/threonine protein phosphatase PrpC